ncbi:hypothetical protein D3C75_863670 [compost metagenome]
MAPNNTEWDLVELEERLGLVNESVDQRRVINNIDNFSFFFENWVFSESTQLMLHKIPAAVQRDNEACLNVFVRQTAKPPDACWLVVALVLKVFLENEGIDNITLPAVQAGVEVLCRCCQFERKFSVAYGVICNYSPRADGRHRELASVFFYNCDLVAGFLRVRPVSNETRIDLSGEFISE